MAALGGAPYSAALYPGAFPDRNDFILYTMLRLDSQRP